MPALMNPRPQTAPKKVDSAQFRRMLVVEDDALIRMALQDFFAAEGFSVETVEDGEKALAAMGREPFDIVLLDVMLPKKNGFEVLKESQERNLAAPVLMLTARGEPEAILKGFGLGAADYVLKPFSPEDLSSRVEKILGRWKTDTSTPPATYTVRSIEIDFEAQTARSGETNVPFIEQELDLLRYLIQNAGHVVTRKRLLRDVFGIDADFVSLSIDEDVMRYTLDRHITSLREKIEPNPTKPTLIETVYGLGYRFNG